MIGTAYFSFPKTHKRFVEMTKNIFLATICAAILPSMTLADWNGFYGGVSFGQATSVGYDVDIEPDVDLPDGSALGVFGGVRVDTNGFVWGTEIAVEVLDEATISGGEYQVESLFDLKVIAGIPAGNFLGYGILSASGSTGNYSINDVDTWGMGLGAGISYKLGDNFSLSGEYMSRKMTQEFDVATVDVAADTLTLRAAYHF